MDPRHQVGPYQIVGTLGAGGMGAVYQARDPRSGRDVALKIVRRPENPVTRERFAREGALTAALDHPGILKVHSAGEEGGNLYLAYELVPEARSLDQACLGRPLAERVHLVRDAARALGHAHEHGIVHRDVKPANLLVDPEGQVKVADFGLATAQELERLTRTGAFVGTPSYMAPEQFAGKGEFSPATDVWALGVVLYEALTGEVPFPAEDMFSLARQVSDGSVEHPREHVPDLPEGLCNACLRALHTEPNERYPNADAFADALERALEGDSLAASAPARVRRWVRRRRGTLVSAGVLCAALGALALAALVPTDTPKRADSPSPAGAQRKDPAVVSKTEEPRADGGLHRLMILEHACEDAAFLGADRVVTVGAGEAVFWRLRAEPQREWALAVPLAARVAVARERSLVLIGAGKELWFIDAETRELRFPTLHVKDLLEVKALTVSPSGDFGAISVGRRVVVVDLDTGRSVVEERGPAAIRSLSFSHDSEQVLAAWGNSKVFANSCAFLRLDGTWSQPPPGDPSRLNRLQRDPDPGRGWWVCYDSGGVGRLSPTLEQVERLDGEIEVSGSKALLAAHLAHPASAHDLVHLEDGRLLSVAGGDDAQEDDLRVWGSDGSLQLTVPHPDREKEFLSRVVTAPDHQRILVVLDKKQAELWSVPAPAAPEPSVASAEPLATLEHSGCRAVLFADERTVLTGGANGVFRWRIEGGKARREDEVRSNDNARSMVLDTERGLLIVGTSGGFLEYFDLGTMEPKGQTTTFQRALFTPVEALALVPDGSGDLMVAHGDRVTRFDPGKVDRVWRYECQELVTALAASEKRILVGWGGGKGLRGNGLALLEHDESVAQIMPLPAGPTVILHGEGEGWWVADESGRVASIKPINSRLTGVLEDPSFPGSKLAHQGPARGLAALPDGRMVSVGGSGSGKSAIRIWAADGSLLADWARPDPGGSYGQVVVSPDGKLFVVQLQDGAEVWAVPE